MLVVQPYVEAQVDVCYHGVTVDNSLNCGLVSVEAARRRFLRRKGRGQTGRKDCKGVPHAHRIAANGESTVKPALIGLTASVVLVIVSVGLKTLTSDIPHKPDQRLSTLARGAAE